MGKYQAPELTVLMLAINAIQGFCEKQVFGPDEGSTGPIRNETCAAYEDWE